MPRVVAGKAKGTILIAPKGRHSRPTADKTKEAIFSSIDPYLYDAKFLDLFAGTGQMGIEALSRAASEAVFVDNSRPAIQAIRTNLKKTHLEDQARVLQSSANSAVKKLLAAEEVFDIIYFDPPYADFANLLEQINESSLAKLLNDDGILIIEEDSQDFKEENAVELTMFTLLRRGKYGQAMVSFYEKI